VELTETAKLEQIAGNHAVGGQDKGAAIVWR